MESPLEEFAKSLDPISPSPEQRMLQEINILQEKNAWLESENARLQSHIEALLVVDDGVGNAGIGQ